MFIIFSLIHSIDVIAIGIIILQIMADLEGLFNQAQRSEVILQCGKWIRGVARARG